jgi:hypothetical protein
LTGDIGCIRFVNVTFLEIRLLQILGVSDSAATITF